MYGKYLGYIAMEKLKLGSSMYMHKGYSGSEIKLHSNWVEINNFNIWKMEIIYGQMELNDV